MRRCLLSLLMITKNAEETIEKSLKSVVSLVDEIVIVDGYSKDRTVEIAKKYGAKIYFYKGLNLGKQAKLGLTRCQGRWILVLDADECLSKGLNIEIKKIKNLKTSYAGFYLPFQNHFLGKKVYYGGENYQMLRLFKRKFVDIKPALVHHKFHLKKGKAGELKNKVYHYSYRSLLQVYKKFTDYAIREAKTKIKNGEESSLKKIILYPLHMFYARFIKDKGYKDGLFRIPLDLGFAYMEFVTYLWLWLWNLKKLKIRSQK
ncbi:MAG: glycosyltransferase family 2 protein [Patescibacteria group bacterium]|nr:glycosyltransferase family 2 protein [Patescibacteria group bacterium]